MIDREEFRRWSAAAADARRGAEVQRDAGLHQWSCFLAEQAAQLAVKGVLHGVGAHAWGHNLVELCEGLSRQSGRPVPDEVLAAARRLSRHYIPTLYPDAHAGGPPGKFFGPEDSAQALNDLDAILSLVDSLVGDADSP